MKGRSVNKYKRISIQTKSKVELISKFFYFMKSLKESDSSQTFSNKCYLVDKSFLENYIPRREYDTLKNYLKKFNFCNFSIDNLIIHLPNNIFENFEIKYNKLEISTKINYKYAKELIDEPNKMEYLYLYDYIIISPEILNVMSNSTPKDIIKANYYKINKDKFLIYYFTNEKCGSEIGYIDNNNVFIPEYLVDYYINDQKIIKSIKNKFSYIISSEDRNYINISEPDINYYCYKIKKEKIIDKNVPFIPGIEKGKYNHNLIDRLKLNSDIISLNKKYKLNIDSYNCIKCDSDIELISINFSNQEEDNSQIKFKCRGVCSKEYSMTFKQYINEMINYIYLTLKCCICGNAQIKKIKEIFSLCSFCNEIFCNNNKCILNDKCSKNNNRFVKINELKKMCMKHINYPNNYYNKFCYDDNANLCDNCLGDLSHKEHKREDLIEMHPFESKEEEDILKKTIKYLENKIDDIYKNRINGNETIKRNKVEEINENYINEIDKLNTEKETEINKCNKKYEDIVNRINMEFYNDINKTAKEIKNEYNNKNININLNDILKDKDNNENEGDIIKVYNENELNNKYEIIENFILNEEKYILEKKNKIQNLKEHYKSTINKINKEKNANISELKKKNKEKLKECEEKKDESLNKVNEEYECKLNEINNTYNKNQKDLYYKKIFIEIIVNSYNNIKNNNFYYIKNMLKLMVSLYDDKEIYEKIIKEIIDNSKSKDKLIEIVQNKKIKLEEIEKKMRNNKIKIYQTPNPIKIISIYNNKDININNNNSTIQTYSDAKARRKSECTKWTNDPRR